MENRSPGGGRPRGSDAAVPELQGADTLTLARWVAGATSGGISQKSAARLAGISVRHAQRLMDRHADDGFVARDRLIGQALRWEQQGAEALAEACSRATAWMRQASSKEGADIKEVAAAFGATVAASHRLAEIGSRRARRLQPEPPQQQNRTDIGSLIEQLGQAAEAIRALPPDQRDGAWKRVREGLRPDQQAQPIEVAAVTVLPEAEATEPPTCPL